MSKHVVAFILIFLFALPLMLPFLKSGFFPTHDGGWAVVRLSEMHREIKDIQIPPRWSTYLNHGYGYPLFLFSYPFPYYIAEVFHLAGLGLIDSIKTEFIFTVLASGLTMFLLGKTLWGFSGGLVASVLYLYAPYRLTNLYVRGSLGESLASVFFPLLFLLVYRLIKSPSAGVFILFSMSLSAFILTHNVMVLLFMPLLVLWAVIIFFTTHSNHRRIIPLLSSFVLSLLLSAFFWLPAIVEKKFLILSTMPIAVRSHHFLKLSQLWMVEWGFGVTPPLLVGAVFLLSGIAGCFYLFVNHKTRILGVFFSIVLLLSLIMLFPVSDLIWQLPLLAHIDFPWRMLGIVIFMLSLAGGSLASLRYGKIISLAICIGAVFASSGYIKTQPPEMQNDTYFASNDATTTSMDELMPVWVAEKPKERPTMLARVQDSNIITSSSSSDELKLQVEMPTDGEVLINQIYFPGWKAYSEGREISITTQEVTGLMKVSLPRGSHELQLLFMRTPVRILADFLTLLGLVLLITMRLWSKKQFHIS